MENESNFIEGKDFEITSDGRVVMTKQYLSKRGRCCNSGCMNCPYGFTEDNKVDPNVPQELQDNWSVEDDGQFKMDFEFRG
jgi:hypothetical protein